MRIASAEVTQPLHAKQSLRETVATAFLVAESEDAFVLMRSGTAKAATDGVIPEDEEKFVDGEVKTGASSKSDLLKSVCNVTRPCFLLVLMIPTDEFATLAFLRWASSTAAALLFNFEATKGLTQAWEGTMKSSKLLRNTLPDILTELRSSIEGIDAQFFQANQSNPMSQIPIRPPLNKLFTNFTVNFKKILKCSIFCCFCTFLLIRP